MNDIWGRSINRKASALRAPPFTPKPCRQLLRPPASTNLLTFLDEPGAAPDWGHTSARSASPEAKKTDVNEGDF